MSARGGLEDTDRDARAIMTRLYARMTPADKLARIRDLTVGSYRLALAGLRVRHPGVDDRVLLSRLAAQRLGSDVFALVYGEGEEVRQQGGRLRRHGAQDAG